MAWPRSSNALGLSDHWWNRLTTGWPIFYTRKHDTVTVKTVHFNISSRYLFFGNTETEEFWERIARLSKGIMSHSITQVITEMFFPANPLASTEETRSHPEMVGPQSVYSLCYCRASTWAIAINNDTHCPSMLILTPQQPALSVIEQFSYCPIMELHNDSGYGDPA